MGEQKRKITIKVNETPIQIAIDPKEEETYRRAEKELKLMFNQFANNFNRLDCNVILSAVAYELMFYKITTEDELSKIGEKVQKAITAAEE